MRTVLCKGALLVALAWPSTPSLAADGIKASATASRKVPADILTVSFHLIERSKPEERSQLRTEEARLRGELAKTGAKIVSWASNLTVVSAGFNSSTFNYIGSGSKEPQAVDTRREVIMRLTGITDAEPIAAVLGRHGVRHSVNFNWSASQADAVRDALTMEAVTAAVVKARIFAERSGAKAGNVIDLQVSGAGAMPQPSEVMSYSGSATMISRSSAPLFSEVVNEDEQGKMITVSATAIVTLQAKPD